MKKTMKVQGNSSNRTDYIVLPREMRRLLNINKGDTVLLSTEENKIIMEKC